MSIMNDLNNIGKNKNFLIFAKVLLVIGILNVLAQQGMIGLGRAGFGTSLTALAIALIVIGWIFIIIPEPTTTIVGIIMVIVGVMLSWALIESVIESIGSMTSILIGIGLIILFVIIKR